MTAWTDTRPLRQTRRQVHDPEPTVAGIFAAHHDRMLRLAVLLLGDQSRAEDAVHTGFGSLHRRWRRFSHPDEALCHLASHLVRASRSATHRGHPADDREADRLPPDHREVVEALARLPSRQREPLVLHYGGGFSATEIAGILRRSPHTLRLDAGRAAATLVHELDEDEPAHAEHRLVTALRARAELVEAVPAEPPNQRSTALATRERPAAGWPVVGLVAALVCGLMAAVAVIATRGPTTSGPDPDRNEPPRQVLRRTDGDLTITAGNLLVPVSPPFETVAFADMPYGGGRCLAFDYPMRPNGQVDPSLSFYAQGGCRSGLVVQPRNGFAQPAVPFAQSRSDLAVGECDVTEQSLVVTSGGLTAEHTAFDCGLGPLDQWLFREYVVWSLDPVDEVRAMVRGTAEAAGELPYSPRYDDANSRRS